MSTTNLGKYACTLLLLCTLGGCASSPSPESLAPPASIGTWSSKHFHKGQTLNINLNVAQNGNAKIMLIDGDYDKTIQQAVLKITLDDENCTTGHQAHVDYFETTSQIKSLYFDSIFEYGKPIQLGLTLNKNNTVAITLNDETHEILLKANFDKLQLESCCNTMQVNQFLITDNAKNK